MLQCDKKALTRPREVNASYTNRRVRASKECQLNTPLGIIVVRSDGELASPEISGKNNIDRVLEQDYDLDKMYSY